VVSSTNRLLDKPTLAAVRQWTFTPAMKDGVAVSVKVVQPVAFTIPYFHSDATSRVVTETRRPVSQAMASATSE